MIFIFHYLCRLWRQMSHLSLLVIFFVFFCSASSQGAEPRKELLIGLEPEHNIFDQVQKYRALSEYLSSQLGVDVKLTIMSRFGEVVQRLSSRNLDGAILSSYTAMLAINQLALTPVASLVNLDDTANSHGYIFVRKDSGIADISDMRDKSVVFVDPATMEGYVFARAFFRSHGIADMDTYFSSHYFSGSHASAVFAVLDGRVDIGSAKDTVLRQLVKRDPTIQDELRIIAESPPVPEVTFCLKSDLGPALLKKIQALLLNMWQTGEGHRVLRQMEARRFIAFSPEDFEVVSEMAEEAGLIKTNGLNGR